MGCSSSKHDVSEIIPVVIDHVPVVVTETIAVAVASEGVLDVIETIPETNSEYLNQLTNKPLKMKAVNSKSHQFDAVNNELINCLIN